MRAEGKTQQEICDFINSQGYQKYITKRGGHVTFPMSDSTLSNVFKDTFYFGELNQAGQTIDLVAAPIPFEPMVDRELFSMVQELSKTRRRTSKLSRKPFLPIRYVVFCDVCQFHKPMQVGHTTGRDKVSRLNYACLNKECTRERGYKSIRGMLVFSEIDRVINEKLSSLPDSAYDKYLKELKTYSDTARIKLRSELSRARTVKTGYDRKVSDLSSTLAGVKDERVKKVLTQQLTEAVEFVQEQEQIIQTSQQSLERSTLPAINKEEFKATLKEMSQKLKAADVVQKDIIVSNLFLKLYFDQQKMTQYSLNEPFASLVALSGFQWWGRSHKF